MIHKPRFACKWGEGREGCVGFWAFNGRRLGCTQAEGGLLQEETTTPNPPSPPQWASPAPAPLGAAGAASPASDPAEGGFLSPPRRGAG